MSDKETHWKEWKASGGLRGRSQMSDKPWNPEVERIRKAMMERFSDKLSMEEIAEFAYSFAVECTAPAPQPASLERFEKWWCDVGRHANAVRKPVAKEIWMAAATPQVTPTERKYEALYAEARESLCSCNHADPSAEPGSSMNYTCEWCEKHPEGADSPPIIKRLFAAEEELERLKAVPSATRKESGREETTVASSADRLTAAIDDYAAKVRGRILMNTESNASAETEARVALLKLWEGTSEQASPTPDEKAAKLAELKQSYDCGNLGWSEAIQLYWTWQNLEARRG